jgi:hypothetical protein
MLTSTKLEPGRCRGPLSLQCLSCRLVSITKQQEGLPSEKEDLSCDSMGYLSHQEVSISFVCR